MTLRQYFVMMSIATGLCWIAWGVVLFRVNPFTAQPLGLAFFYLTLFFACVGTLSLLLYPIYRLRNRHHALSIYRSVLQSFQSSIIVGLIGIGLLYLQSLRLLLTWTTGVLLVLGVLILLFFLTLRRHDVASE